MAHTYTACIKAAKAIATRHTYKQQLKLWPCTQKNQRRHSLKNSTSAPRWRPPNRLAWILNESRPSASPAAKEAAQTEWRAFPPSASESSSPPDSASRRQPQRFLGPDKPRVASTVGQLSSRIRRMKRGSDSVRSSGIILSLSKESFQGSDRTTLLTLLCKHSHHRTDGNRNS